MKKIVTLILLLSSMLFAVKLEYINSYDEALQKAKSEDKMLLVMFTMDGCPACEYMKDVAFDSERLNLYLSHYFIICEIDYKDPSSYPQGLNPFGTPTFYIQDSSGNTKGRAIVGGHAAPVFLGKLQEYK
ncbi:MAG: thioredoxin fold domain-containing protein [Arcobacter butzleri]|nr:thioredoxin fold domain-containing protein [Aliarcobacter butzleri]